MGDQEFWIGTWGQDATLNRVGTFFTLLIGMSENVFGDRNQCLLMASASDGQLGKPESSQGAKTPFLLHSAAWECL